MVMHEQIEHSFSLEGRVAVVTGAASGIGRQAALTFSQAGARVVLADINQQGLEETAALVGTMAHICVTDMAVRDAIGQLAAEALTLSERIDIWANVAGIAKSFNILDAEEDEVDQILNVNLKGVYWACQAAGKVMVRQQRGSIINISSAAGDSSPEGMSVYAMSKAGVNALTRAVAKELGAYGVRANAIAPGFIETPMVDFRYTNQQGEVDRALREETLNLRRQAAPLKLTGEPADIANAMLYLASDASRFMTGQVMRVNGGVSML